MMEETENLWKKYGLVCKECGHSFLPWKSFMVTEPKNGMKPFIYCPKCRNFDDLENFKDD